MARRLSQVVAERTPQSRGSAGAVEPFWEVGLELGERAGADRLANWSAVAALVPAAIIAAAWAAAAIAASG